MDEIVKAALKKWPDVPHVYGWLALDARGDWWLRDERAQAAGPFPQVRGSRIEHAMLKAFIERNYEHDARGCWYFQNGPQRVYVALEAAPWVWRVEASGDGPPSITSHTGLPARAQSAWTDEAGRLFLATELGLGLVHTLDMDAASDAVASGAWKPEHATVAQLQRRFGFVTDPQPDRG
jgi:hypothetical protein